MKLVPITLRQSKEFVSQFHRHNVAPQGHKFSIGLKSSDTLIGVIIVGRPIARHNDDGLTAEITRCCVIEGYKNANSMLYAAAWRAAKAMGYRRIITYTLPDESGASLRVAGFIKVRCTKFNSNGWNSPSRPRAILEKYPTGIKILWQISTNGV